MGCAGGKESANRSPQRKPQAVPRASPNRQYGKEPQILPKSKKVGGNPSTLRGTATGVFPGTPPTKTKAPPGIPPKEILKQKGQHRTVNQRPGSLNPKVPIRAMSETTKVSLSSSSSSIKAPQGVMHKSASVKTATPIDEKLPMKSSSEESHKRPVEELSIHCVPVQEVDAGSDVNQTVGSKKSSRKSSKNSSSKGSSKNKSSATSTAIGEKINPDVAGITTPPEILLAPSSRRSSLLTTSGSSSKRQTGGLTSTTSSKSTKRNISTPSGRGRMIVTPREPLSDTFTDYNVFRTSSEDEISNSIMYSERTPMLHINPLQSYNETYQQTERVVTSVGIQRSPSPPSPSRATHYRRMLIDDVCTPEDSTVYYTTIY